MSNATRAASIAFLALLAFSVVSAAFSQQAQALSAITFTTKTTISSSNPQFQRLYENGTNSVITLDATSGATYQKNTYNVAAGTAASATTTLSGSGNTINSAAYTSPVDLSRYSLNFNGVDQYGTVTDNSNIRLTNQWAIGFRINTSSPSVGMILSKHIEGVSGYEVQYNNDGTLSLVIHRGGAAPGYDIITSQFWNLGVWQSVYIIFNNGAVSFFVDGAAKGTGTASVSSVPTNTNDLYISRRDSGGLYVPMTIDDLVIYNTLKTSGDASNFASGSISSGGLVLWQDYNDGIGTTAKDVSGNSNSASLFNTPTWSTSVSTVSLSRPTTYIIGRDTTTGKNGYGKINLSDLSKVSDGYQVSSYYPRNIAQSTTNLYSPLYDATTNGNMRLGIQTRAFGSYSEPLIYSGSSGNPAHGVLMDLSGSASGVGTNLYAGNSNYALEHVTSSSALIGKKLDKITLYLSKTGAPTGTATIGVFNAAGTTTYTCNTQDVSLLTGSATAYSYVCPGPYVIQSGDYIGIKYTGGSAGNSVDVQQTNNNDFDGTASVWSAGLASAFTDVTTKDLKGVFADTANVKIAVLDGSPDTEYVFFESGTSSLAVVKYTNSATTISTSLAHTAGKEYSIMQMSGVILIQTDSTTYSLNTSTDVITTAYGNTFPTRYPQSFTISPSARTYNSAAPMIANSTTAYFATPSTGAIVQTGVLVSSTNDSAGTLTTYQPARYYYLPTNGLTVEASSATGTTWTIKSVGSSIQIAPTAYSEHLNVGLQTNSTLYGQDVFRIACTSGSYHAIYSRYAIGSDSDCAKWAVLPSSSNINGRELYIPYSRTQDLVHTSPMTSYTFTINSGTPTYYYLKSSYGGKVVDVANFDSSGQAQQRYLYGQCYTVAVTNTNTGASALAGNICAGDSTTKPIDVNAVQVPVNWQGTAWAYNTNRNYTTPTNNIVTFVLQKNQQPWNASIHVVDNQFSTPGFNQWYNYTNQSAAKTVTISGINGNQTLYFNVFENGNSVINTVVQGQGFNLNGLGFSSLGAVFGIPIAGLFVIIIGGVFTRSSATFGFVAVLATIGVMVTFGLLSINPAFWAALMGMAAVGIFAYKRYN